MSDTAKHTLHDREITSTFYHLTSLLMLLYSHMMLLYKIISQRSFHVNLLSLRLGEGLRIILMTFSSLILLSLGACSESPQCVPGRTVACPCVPVGEGIQRCAEDGSRYLECECGHLPPPIQSMERSSSNPVLKASKSESRAVESITSNKPSRGIQLLNRAVPSSFASNTPGTKVVSASSTADQFVNSRKARAKSSKKRSVKVVPLEAEIADASDHRYSTKEKLSATKMFKLNLRNQQKRWWFYSETLERCVLAEDVNGIDYAPLKLLSEGCYRLGDQAEMTIRCDDPPLGPHTYRFSDRESQCISNRSDELTRARQKKNIEIKIDTDKRPVKIAVLDPVIEAESRRDRQPRNRARSVSASDQTPSGDREWHCMCYEEVVKGDPKLSTACRPSREMCVDLSKKVKEGSKVLIKGSQLASCQTRRGSSPWRLFQGKGSRRYFWQPSSHPGAWWSAEGCFLPVSKRKRAAYRAKRNKRGTSKPSQSSIAAKVKSTSAVKAPSELYRSIGTRRSLIRFGEKGSAPKTERCREACRANLISASERRVNYGVSNVPSLLRWGKSFADRVKLVKTICMSNQGKAKRGRERCLNKVINKCSIYCERASD